MAMAKPTSLCASSSSIFSLLLLSTLLSINGQSYVGVNYGEVASILPAASATVKLLQSTTISKVRMFGVDPNMMRALANTGIGVVIGVDNGDIPALASDPGQASKWVSSNVLPYYPATQIILITVGNEILTSGDKNQISGLVGAMQNIQNALNAGNLGGKIKVSTVHSMNVLSQSLPPSAGAFDTPYTDTMKQVLQFLTQNSSPLAINPYPYFVYQADPTADTLAFCLFDPNAGVRTDPKNGKDYNNMFDALVDAARTAAGAVGYGDVDIVVAETGWPTQGGDDEVGASLDNARAYNGGLVAHLRSMVGTPLVPGKSVDTYIFDLYDENLKTGSTSEKFYGLYKPDMSVKYDAGLSKSSPGPSPKPSSGEWCVPKQGVPDAQLQGNLDYACGQGIDCSPIQRGGVCFEPNTVASHAAYAMNLYYQKAGRNPSNCDFGNTGIVTNTNPSYNSCVYPTAS